MPSAREISYSLPVPVDGLRLDMDPTSMPPTALVYGTQNVVLRRGRVQPRYGFSSFASDVGAPVRGVIDYGPSVGLTGVGVGIPDSMVAGTDSAWYKYAAGSWTALTGAISASNHIIFRIFSKNGIGYVVGINDGVDFPKRWDGVAAGISTVGGSPPKPKAMMLLANRLLLFNLTGGGAYSGVVSPSGYDVSAFNDFEAGWSTTLNGLLIDTPGDIVAALEMGDLQGVIYKSDAIIMAVAQAATVPFHFEWKSFGNVGPVNSRCVFSVQDGSHIYLGADGGVYRFDGVTPVSLGVHIQKAILRAADLDLTQLATKAWGFYDKTRNEAFFYFKGTGVAVISGVMIALSNLSVWPVSIGISGNDTTAGGLFYIPSVTTPRVAFFTGSTGKSWYDNYNSTDNGSSISIGITYPVSDLGLPAAWKTLTEIDARIAFTVDDPGYTNAGGSQDLILQVEAGDGGDISTPQTDTVTVSLGGGPYIRSYRYSARLLGLTLVGPSTKFWEFRGATLRATLRGER